MEATGVDSPVVYVLGEAPGQTEDERGEQFVGKAGALLRSTLGRDFIREYVRWNNSIRCHPPDNRDPLPQEVECCRGFIVEDIERTKPKIILGTGNVPISWATQLTPTVSKWRGRLIPIRVGTHTCWFYSVFHPSYVIRRQAKYVNEWERTFTHDIDWLVRLVKSRKIPTPEYIDSGFSDGVVVFDVCDRPSFRALEKELQAQANLPYIAIDLETSGLRPYHKNSTIYTAAVGTFNRVVAFPVDDPRGWVGDLRKSVRDLFVDFLCHSGRKIAQNTAFEQEWLAYHYGELLLYHTEWEDTMAQAYTLDERPGTHSLGTLTLLRYGFDLKSKSTVDPARFLEFPLADGLLYNGMDSKWTYKLFFDQQKDIQAVRAYELEYQRQMRLCPALVLAQLGGLDVDEGRAETLSENYSASLREIERKLARCPEIDLYTRRYGQFSVTSPQNVITLFRDVLKRPEVIDDSGNASSDEEALSQIPASVAPSASLILEHRALSKLQSTYVQPILTKRIVYPDGKIHSKYNAMVARTGRLSSEDPNNQNFPKRKHLEVRSIIVPPPGHQIVSVDYGQIEARVIAMASGDRNLVKYLWEGYDIHAAWARRFLDEYPELSSYIADEFDVSSDKAIFKTLRQETKNKWVFPQFFGSHFSSCAASMRVPNDIAEELAAEFWREFDGVKKWQNRVIAGWERNLYVENMNGRRRRGPLGRNEIINTPIQGTAATDIVEEAMASLALRGIVEDRPALIPKLNVHDDLTFLIPDVTFEADVSDIVYEMCKIRYDWINVPIVVEVSVGRRWGEQEELGVFSSELFKNGYRRIL